ncbi:hypothetical protein V1283_001442 [Bradyrhizobium sp. AZCC 2262]|uniref:hypothetical protein n=1 Tax=Bradyrhizobium sp. AZCC 2262 TaxID=3117022 RepID=UPI002FF18309
MKRKAMPFAPCAPAIQPRALRILPQQCDNEAVVHNKEKLSRKSQSRQHRVRKRSMRPVVVHAGRQVLSVGSVDAPTGIFDPFMKPTGRWRD